VVAIPEVGSLASSWSSARTGAIKYFDISVGPQAQVIVELIIEYTLNNDEGAQSVSAAVAAATVGQIYTRALDNTTTAVFVVSGGQGLLQI
jgi:hypothetical protein